MSAFKQHAEDDEERPPQSEGEHSDPNWPTRAATPDENPEAPQEPASEDDE